MSETYTPPPLQQRPQRTGVNCLLLSAIGCGALLLLFLLLIVFAFYSVRTAVRKLADEWTDPAASELPKSTMPPETYAALSERFDAFKQGLRTDAELPPLVLTSEDINALIQNHPDWEAVRGHAHVTLDGDKLKAQVSIPLDWLPLVEPGRYLNGSAALDVSVDEGVLYVYLADITVKGRSAPQEAMAGFRARNLAENLNRSPDLAPYLRKIRSVRIADGELYIEPMGAEALPAEAPVNETEGAPAEAPAEPEAEQEESAATPL